MQQRVLSLALLLTLLFLTPAPAGAQLFWNQAASFAGSSASYLAVPNSPELDITGSFTVECWINPANITTPTAQIILGKWAGSSVQYDFRLSPSGRPAGTFAIRTNGVTRAYSSGSIAEGVWSHIAVSYDAPSTTFRFFINGSLDSTALVSGATPSSGTDSVIIGKGLNNPFAGTLDEIRLWNVALPDTAISRNYRSSLGITGGAYNGLVMSLTFQDDEPLGTLFSLTDWSGNGNNALNRGVTAVDYSYAPPTYLAFNEALDVRGTEDYLAGADNAALSPTSAVTLEAWVWPRVGGTGVLISKGITGAAYRLLVGGTGNEVRGVINGTVAFATDSAHPGQWSHLAFTYESSGAYQFFVNGLPAGSGTIAGGTITDNADSLVIGGGPGIVDFNGFMDEVRISHYVKTQEEIRRFMFASIDDLNEPNSGSTNICFNLDGGATDACGDYGLRLSVKGDARFSAPATISNVPVAPLNRLAPGAAFAAGYAMKSTLRRIPEAGTSGYMIVDSLYIGQTTTITDLNLFVGLNHTFDSDLEIRLIAPNGDSVQVAADWGMRATDDNIITIFDDNADSSYVGSRYTALGPAIRPANGLNAAFSGRNAQGWWLLSVYDDAGGDTGYVYGWGIQINNQTVVGVGELPAGVPTAFALEQNYPNPFNPATTIEYAVGERGPVTLEVFDVLGRKVATLVNEVKEPGRYRAVFDARAVASGTYFYRLTARENVHVRKMLFLR